MKKIQEFNGFIGAEGVETNTLFCSQIATKGLTFSIEDDTYAEVTGYTGNAIHVYIPDFWNGYPVTVIGARAFENTNIVSVRTPKFLAEVLDYAFNNCIHLKEIELGESIEGIGEYVFGYCPSMEKMTVKATTYPSDEPNSYNFGGATPTLYRPAIVTDLSKWESLEGAGFILAIETLNVNAGSATNTSFTNKPFVEVADNEIVTKGTYQVNAFARGQSASAIICFDGNTPVYHETIIYRDTLSSGNEYLRVQVSDNGVLDCNIVDETGFNTPAITKEFYFRKLD